MQKYLRRYGLTVLIYATSLLLVISCGKKPEPAPPSNPAEHLEPGTGAVLVIFPPNAAIAPADFHAAVMLYGDTNVSNQPRILLPAQKAMMVTNLPPGKYRAMSNAWTVPGTPFAGGELKDVAVSAGQITVLKAAPVTDDRIPFPKTHLEPAGQVPWSYNPAQKFPDYIAGIIGSVRRG